MSLSTQMKTNMSLILNSAKAIKKTSQKKQFRLSLHQHQLSTSVLTVMDSLYTSGLPMVLRPASHSKGNNFHVANTVAQAQYYANLYDDWYAAPLIDKAAEYRIFVVEGKVVAVAEKVPNDPSNPTWNHAQSNAIFYNTKWDNWPLEVCHKAIKAMKLGGLDFGGVDVCIDKDGNSFVLEVNSAPMMQAKADGTMSYRQKCILKAFTMIYEKGEKTTYETKETPENWRDVVHPAIWSPSH